MGKMVRGIDQTLFIIEGENFVLSRHNQSDLIRLRHKVSLVPRGTISPERSGVIRIDIPGKSHCFVHYRKLWSIIDPRGKGMNGPVYRDGAGGGW